MENKSFDPYYEAVMKLRESGSCDPEKIAKLLERNAEYTVRQVVGKVLGITVPEHFPDKAKEAQEKLHRMEEIRKAPLFDRTRAAKSQLLTWNGLTYIKLSLDKRYRSGEGKEFLVRYDELQSNPIGESERFVIDISRDVWCTTLLIGNTGISL